MSIGMVTPSVRFWVLPFFTESVKFIYMGICQEQGVYLKDFGFTGGRPDPYTFPTEGLIAASEKALRKLGGDLVNYPGESGYQGLRELASMRFERREGIPLPIDNISITQAPCRHWNWY